MYQAVRLQITYQPTQRFQAEIDNQRGNHINHKVNELPIVSSPGTIKFNIKNN